MSSNGSVWLKNGKVILRGGEVFLYPECPCDCEPKVLGSKVLNGSSENEDERCWDLTPYQGNEIGTPGFHWRLIEVGEDGSRIWVDVEFEDCVYQAVTYEMAWQTKVARDRVKYPEEYRLLCSN